MVGTGLEGLVMLMEFISKSHKKLTGVVSVIRIFKLLEGAMKLSEKVGFVPPHTELSEKE